MNNTKVAWTVAALVLGGGGIYAVCSVDDSIAQAKTQAVVAVQDNSGFLSSPIATSSATSTAPSPVLSSKAQDAVNINPFGK